MFKISRKKKKRNQNGRAFAFLAALFAVMAERTMNAIQVSGHVTKPTRTKQSAMLIAVSAQ